MKSGIYCAVNLRNGKRYVGSSKNADRRWHGHCVQLKRGKHNNPHLQGAWNADGGESFACVILEYCDLAEMLRREAFWIEFYGSRDPVKGYNICHPDRHEVSPETRAKISATLSGRAKTPEHIEKVASFHRGRKLTPEQLERHRSVDRRCSPEARARGAEKRRGRVQSAETIEKRAAKVRGSKRSADAIARTVATRRATCGYGHTEETRAKLSAAWEGKSRVRPHSEATKMKIREATKDNPFLFQGGHSPWNKGRPCSEETKARIAATKAARRAAGDR